MAITTLQVEGGAVEAFGDACGDVLLRPLPFTKHARKRGARRNVTPDAVDYVLAYGRMIHRTGVTFFFLGRRDIPPTDRRATWASRLEGTIVLLASDGGVITVYRNRRGLRTVQRKLKYRLSDLSSSWAEDTHSYVIESERETA